MNSFSENQWNFFLKNLGEWHGSFAKFSADGEAMDELPTVVAVTAGDNDRVQVAVDYLTDRDRNVTWTFGAVPEDMTVFEGGEFSRGDLWLHGLSNAGFEQGLIDRHQRVRLVQVYRLGKLAKVVLIREALPGETIANGHRLTVEDLVGVWRGQAVTVSVKSLAPTKYPTQLTIEVTGNRLVQELTFGDRTISSSAIINGSVLNFDEGLYPARLLMLPGGVSSNCPEAIPTGHPFVAELGWMISNGERARIIRCYDKAGNWESTTLVTERLLRGA